MTLSLLLGAVVGLVLGLTGAGGSVFAVPLLMFGLGWPLADAAPVALLAVSAAAALGTVTAWEAAFVRYRAAVLMSLTGAMLAPLGLYLAHRLPPRILAGLFGVVLVIVAVRMFVQSRKNPAEAAVTRAAVAGDGARSAGPICLTDSETGRLVWTAPCAGLLSMVGAATGFLSGLLGVGGGFVIVPSLRAATALSIHSAIATSLMVIALTSSATVAINLLLDGPYPWGIALPFVTGSLLGMLAGRRIAPRIAGPKLQAGFAVSMLVVAALMGVRALA